MRAIASALGVVGGVESREDRSTDDRGRPQHLRALAHESFDGALFGIAGAAIGASGQMLLGGAKLVGAQLTIDVSRQVFLDVSAAVQVIVLGYGARFFLLRPQSLSTKASLPKAGFALTALEQSNMLHVVAESI